MKPEIKSIKIISAIALFQLAFSLNISAQYTGGDADGWAKRTSQLMPLINFLYANITPGDTVVCTGAVISLNGNPIMGDPPYSHSWTGNTTYLSSTTIQNPVFTASVPGTYLIYYTVTDISLNTYTDSVVIIVSPPPTANAGADDTICQGSFTTLHATGGASYLWSPSSGLSSTTVSSPFASPLVNTIYTVTVTDAAGCTASDDVAITLNPLPSVNAGSNVAVCNGSSVTLNASGVGACIWITATGLSDIYIFTTVASPAVTTTYTIVVTNAYNCTASDNVTVLVNPLPPAPTVSGTGICEGTSATLTAVAPGGTYEWFNAPSGGTLLQTGANYTTPLLYSTTTYYVQTTVGGCTGPRTAVVVTVYPTPAAPTAQNDTICQNETATLNAISPGGAYGWYNAPSGGLLLQTGAVFTTPQLSSTTSYYVQTTILGCAGPRTEVVVTVYPNPVAYAGGDISLCLGDSASLGATGGITYTWSPSTGLNNPNISDPVTSPLITTTYNVTVCNTFNCTATDDIVITVNPKPVANAGNDLTICSGQSVTLIAGGGEYYSWNPVTGLSDPANDTTIATLSDTTTYTVIVSNSYSCTATDSVAVNVNPLPVAEAGSNVYICSGDSIQLTATGGTGYEWNPATGLSGTGIADPWARPALTTSYSVIVTSNNACTSSDTVTVFVNELPSAFVLSGGGVYCESDSGIIVSFSGSETGIDYHILINGSETGIYPGNGTNIDFTATVPGVYTVYATDTATGCILNSPGSVSVSVAANPVIDSVNVADILCNNGNNGILTIWSQASTEYSINSGSSFQSNNNFTGLLPGTYYIVIRSNDGCTSDTADYSISQPPALTLDSSVVNVNCSSEGIAEIIASGGTSSYIYYWSHSSAVHTPVVSGLSEGTYSVTVVDSHACSDSLNIIISVEPGSGLAVLIDSANVSCNGLSDGSATVGMPDGIPPFSFIWSNAPLNNNPSAGDLSEGQYSVTISDSQSCTSVVSFSLTEPDVLGILLSTGNISCNNLNNGFATASVTGGTEPYSFNWSDGINVNEIHNLSEGVYYITITDAHLCTLPDSVTIINPPVLEINLSYNNPNCASSNDGIASVSVSGGIPPYYYEWSNGGNDSLITDISAGTYNVTVSDQNLCHESGNAILTAPSEIIIGASTGINNDIYLGYIDITVNGGLPPYNYYWSNGAIYEDVADLSGGTYTVTVTDNSACSSSETFNIITPLIIPNTITPNGDGYNDDFEIVNISEFEHVTIQIFNRWGNILFVYNGSGTGYADAENRWNGVWDGKEVPIGAYLYIINIKEFENAFTGELTVIR